MGKSQKKRKRQQQQQDIVPSILKQQNEDDTISDCDLNITIQTLQQLTPEIFHSKRCKRLRQILHPWILSHMRETYDADYRARTTLALQRQNWAEASHHLSACRDFAQIPKQGTIQRWVRDCSNAPNAIQMKLLQLILALQQNNDDTNRHNPNTALAQLCSESSEITVLEAWKWWEHDDHNDEEEKPRPIPSSHIPPDLQAARVVYREAAAARTPPNHFDLILHGNVDIVWEQRPQHVQSRDIPFLPKPSRILTNAVSDNECQQLIQLLTQLSFRPDHPVSASQPTGIDSCEIMLTNHTLFDRVRHVLPETLEVHGTTVHLHSINARWRGFRYTANCTYRPHLDGSWPHTYMQDNAYHCDQNIKSYLTFLMYLNDDFEGGDTRFYLPNQMARGVTPRTGSILVFPQGNVASLIHEGSSVTSGGVKYVIRTDVLYSPEVSS